MVGHAQLDLADFHDGQVIVSFNHAEGGLVIGRPRGVERFREFMLKFPRCDYELFPDIDAIDSWTNAGKYLRTHDLRVAMNEWWKVDEVSTVLSAMDDSRRQKADLKDYLLESMK